tara:strand:+ start:8103 stop:9182 length:1080 start_codon:yes stop_codon:yes gene_type:complete
MAKRGRPKKTDTVKPVKDNVEENIKMEKEVQEFVSEGMVQNDSIPEEKFETPPSFEPEAKSALHKLRDEGSKYSPLGESVTEKEYRTPKVENTNQVGEIDEPYFERPTLDDLVQSNAEDTGESDSPFAQPEINEMSSAAQEESAKGLVEMSLNLYTLGCKGMGNLAKIPEKKLNRLVEEGAIDIGLRVPVDRYNTASVPEIVDNFNNEVGDAFVVTDEFKEEVRPIMTRVFVKNGWGMTDEQQLMMLFGMDLVQKGSVVIQMRKAAQFQLDTFMEMTEIKNGRDVRFEANQSNSEPDISVPKEPEPEEEIIDENLPEEPLEEILESSVETKLGESMTQKINDGLEVNKADLDQVDVDNV